MKGPHPAMIGPFALAVDAAPLRRRRLVPPAGLLLAGVILWTLCSAAAPGYALSGRSDELEQVVLAETPMGPVTALDVLMYDDLNEGVLWDVPAQALLHPESLGAETYLPRVRELIRSMVTVYTIGQQTPDWQPADDILRVRAFGAAQAVWIETVAEPQVVVEKADVNRYYLAHANEYLKRRQAQVRYLFKRVDLKNDAETSAMRTALEALSYRIRQGEIAFAQVAKEQSDAPSAAQDGLLPSFYDGTYFKEFEDQVFLLDQPGQLTPVFEGPGGLYLAQLVSSTPLENIPIESVWDAIADRLHNEHVQHYFNDLLTQHKEENYQRSFGSWWPYLNPTAPVAHVNTTFLDRQDFLRFYGSPVDEQYRIQWGVISRGIGQWIDGEVIMQDLEQRGLAVHRWIRRARELAALPLRAAHAEAASIPLESYATAEAALQTLRTQEGAMQQFRALHLLAFTIEPVDRPEQTPTDQRAARRLAQSVQEDLQAGTLRTEPTPIQLADWHEQAAKGDAAAMKSAIRELKDAAEQTPWTNIKVSVQDRGWQTPMPDSPLARQLAGTPLGGVSREAVTGERRTVLMILESGPPQLDALEASPMLARTIGFAAQVASLRAGALARLEAEKTIRFRF